MSIFNSLGSNYNFGFVLRTLFADNKENPRLQLIEYLKRKYGGEVLLTYKGREALRLALRMISTSESSQQARTTKPSVGICGFTCYAVYEAITREGYRARYLDIGEGDLNFSSEALVKEIHKYPSMKALIVQNTLGFPCEMEKIAKFCKERGIVLIEDLAHSIGTKYSDGREAGTVGDFTVLSFSQDKMVDGISGGALIVRNDKFSIFPTRGLGFLPKVLGSLPVANRRNFQFSKIGKRKQVIDKLYPLFTFLIRKTYGIGFGKVLHAFFKKFGLLSRPMSGLQKDEIFGLPNWYCHLIYRQFMGLEENLILRRKIASIYADGLNANIMSEVLKAQIFKASNLRFPVFVGQSEKRKELIVFLKKQGIFVSDIWYDSPIAPKSYLQLTDYNHDCPNSEKVSSMIVNLPTHKGVSERDAGFIVEKVNEWLE